MAKLQTKVIGINIGRECRQIYNASIPYKYEVINEPAIIFNGTRTWIGMGEQELLPLAHVQVPQGWRKFGTHRGSSTLQVKDLK